MKGARAAHAPDEELIIDYKLIPDYARDELAATTLEAVKNFIRQPGGREALDTRIAAKKRPVAAAH